jgi:hypothetical protein
MQGRFGGSYSTSKDEPQSSGAVTDIKETNITLGFYPGISYAITNKVQLETGFQNLLFASYDHQKRTDQPQSGGTPSSYSSNSISLATGLSNSFSGFVIGFRVLLGS